MTDADTIALRWKQLTAAFTMFQRYELWLLPLMPVLLAADDIWRAWYGI